MNPTFRKVALISASLGLLLSLYLVLKPGDDDEAANTTTAVTTTAPATTTEPSTATAPTVEPSDVVTIRINVRTAQPGLLRRIPVKQGRKVRIVVTSQLADEVHFHGYDLSADVAPGQSATIEFTANAPGRFEIELEQRSIPIAELEVRP